MSPARDVGGMRANIWASSRRLAEPGKNGFDGRGCQNIF